MDSSTPPKRVAIIGASLSGLSLALALSKVSIPCTVYESRPQSYSIGGGIMLSPNGLRILNSLGVYDKIRNKGYHLEAAYIKNETGETTDVYYYGHAKLYGYPGLRIYRQILIQELLTMVREQGVTVNYDTKFTHIVTETKSNVEFAFADGSNESASLLVGADGIYSRVRRHLYPDLVPKYSGFVAVWTAIPISQLRIPPGFERPLSLNTIVAKPGAFIFGPQNFEGSEVMIGVQRRFPEQDRAEWERMLAAKDELSDFLRKDAQDWPDIVQSALEHIPQDDLNIWPYHAVPRLDKWASSNSRVIILGDAAHAIPPSAGQGINQAFEDIYLLASLISRLSADITLPDALAFWQTYRQERVDKVLELATQMNMRRLPPAEQAKLPPGTIWKDESAISGEGGQLRWLYEPRLDEHVAAWIEEMQQKSVSSKKAYDKSEQA